MDDRKSLSLLSTLYQLITCSKVFGESWQLRSQLKTNIRSQVHCLKSLFPESNSHNPCSPREIQTSISDKITSWTTNGSYLYDSVPNSVSSLGLWDVLHANPPQDRQIHFGHPIIASTCKSFYFNRWSDIAVFDRDTFQGSVPKPLVALIGTIVGRSSSPFQHTLNRL